MGAVLIQSADFPFNFYPVYRISEKIFVKRFGEPFTKYQIPALFYSQFAILPDLMNSIFFFSDMFHNKALTCPDNLVYWKGKDHFAGNDPG